MEYQQCAECGIWIEINEWVCNFGICDSCFDSWCPCHDNNPDACPLHPYPDVVLNFGKE